MVEEQTRRMGVDALKALAHPLRVRLYAELTSYGPATASALAARLGESSGATSYHLRSLEKHGYVREDESRGTARDRWWERVPGPIELADASVDAAPGAREASFLVEAEFARLENARYASYLARRDGDDPTWARVMQSSSANLRLTPEELEELGDRVNGLIAEYRGRSEEDGRRRRVDLTFRGWPVDLAEEREDGGP